MSPCPAISQRPLGVASDGAGSALQRDAADIDQMRGCRARLPTPTIHLACIAFYFHLRSFSPEQNNGCIHAPAKSEPKSMPGVLVRLAECEESNGGNRNAVSVSVHVKLILKISLCVLCEVY